MKIWKLLSNTNARQSSIFTYQVCACALDIGVHGMWKSQETFENLSPPSLDQQTLPFLRLKNTKSAIFIKSFVENYSRRLSFNKLKVYKNTLKMAFLFILFNNCFWLVNFFHSCQGWVFIAWYFGRWFDCFFGNWNLGQTGSSWFWIFCYKAILFLTLEKVWIKITKTLLL